jgi:hypothetical protein
MYGMAWKTLTYKLTSSAPLIMHNGQTADPLNKWAKALKQISSKRIEYDGPRTAQELWEDDRFRFSSIVRVGQARVNRMRPIFNDWSAVVTLNVEDTLIDPARVTEWLVAAGNQVGIGDWRPQYGRFTVERVS